METPASRRPFRYRDAAATASPAPQGTARTREPPPYQPQVAELNATAQRAIQSLNRGVNLKHLTTYIEHATGALTENAGEINDRLTDAKARYAKKRQREREIRQNNGDGDYDDADLDDVGRDEAMEKKIEEMEKRVLEITAKMEQGMRRIVDADGDVNTMKDILQSLGQSRGEEASSSQAKRRRVGGDDGGRRRLRGDAGDEDDEEPQDGDDSEEEEEQDAPEIIAASRVWSEKLAEHKRKWEALPMAQRYGKHNSYDAFYRIVHDSKHGNDVPPLPDVSTWFGHLTTQQPPPNGSTAQTTNPRKKRKSQTDADEIAIQSERISIKCPLTLQPFIDPVTSTICSHSFERSAIENMLSRSRLTISAGPGRNVRYLECPVCSAKIIKDHLKTDQVLVSRVRRLNRLAEMEEEDGGMEDEGDEQDEDGDVIMSRPGRNGRNGGGMGVAAVKVEKMRSPTRERSVVPDTQFDAVDDEEEDEEEKGEEDGEEDEEEEEDGSDGASSDQF